MLREVFQREGKWCKSETPIYVKKGWALQKKKVSEAKIFYFSYS